MAAALLDSALGSAKPPVDSLSCTPPPYSANNGSATNATAIIHHRRRITKIARRRTSLLASVDCPSGRLCRVLV